MSVLASGNKETHDLVIRRDLNPFAEPYQAPIGILDMPFGKRLVASLAVVSTYLFSNGLGTKVTSRPFLRSWPTAVLPGALTWGIQTVIATGLFDAARCAGLDVVEEHLRALGAIAREESIPDGPDPGTSLRWSSFLSWWSLTSSVEMATAAMDETPRAWAGAILNSGLDPEVDLETAARWIGSFCAAYEQAAARKESANPVPIEQICRRYPTSQIRPCMSGWEVADTEHGPEAHPLARGAVAGAEG